ncbi:MULTISPECIES: YqjF family protein [Halomicrobium]|uniref:DUF2071 domain-containing protein n=2 Tax=Halomicrobium mukohataei TaxID=57705 RepID=C7NZP2_HALMD|nr:MULTISPECIES: DUF2071 domain-containing protein [Halomicrobium]ACV48810.1 conserved hypothetical protein [Halomicrobium mukohataei DSM 12286]QCD64241.1 DUF2071 domain-containing protein [Halomicrobium mukohataei]QFR19047.1 DUF2071 domain-containing protein [Halomicrobium sp. ZPS1]
MRRLLSMEWRNVLFAHWPVPVETVAQSLPEGLSVDTFDGSAWLGVVPFRMADIRPRGSPIGRSFYELNLRTYVTLDGQPGVYFYNLDADDRLGVAVARRLFRLPYYRARMTAHRHGSRTRLQSVRTHPDAPDVRFRASFEPTGLPEPARDDSLAAFLTERYRFYVADDRGRIYFADIDHPPWDLQPATVTFDRNDLFAASGFDAPDSERVVHFSPGLDVTAGRLHRHR